MVSFEDDRAGCADYEKNTIELNPSIPLELDFCLVGGLFYITYDYKLMLSDGEQYFRVLLHEIGHCKITFKHRIKVPEGYKELERLLKKTCKKQAIGPGELRYRTEDYLSNYYEGDYLEGAIEDFVAYYRSSDFTADHTAVEDWARSEFKKRRNEILTILKNENLKENTDDDLVSVRILRLL